MTRVSLAFNWNGHLFSYNCHESLKKKMLDSFPWHVATRSLLILQYLPAFPRADPSSSVFPNFDIFFRLRCSSSSQNFPIWKRQVLKFLCVGIDLALTGCTYVLLLNNHFWVHFFSLLSDFLLQSLLLLLSYKCVFFYSFIFICVFTVFKRYCLILLSNRNIMIDLRAWCSVILYETSNFLSFWFQYVVELHRFCLWYLLIAEFIFPKRYLKKTHQISKTESQGNC